MILEGILTEFTITKKGTYLIKICSDVETKGAFTRPKGEILLFTKEDVTEIEGQEGERVKFDVNMKFLEEGFKYSLYVNGIAK